MCHGTIVLACATYDIQEQGHECKAQDALCVLQCLRGERDFALGTWVSRPISTPV
jgi:hypothetical protein